MAKLLVIAAIVKQMSSLDVGQLDPESDTILYEKESLKEITRFETR